MSASAPRPISIATDCSGMETPVMALKNLGVAIDHVSSCDVNPHVKKTIMANFPPKVFFDDLTMRDNAAAPKADVYVAGFPCQPFSMAGLQQGFGDARGRGEIFWHVHDYIEKTRPKVFVLENVSGLIKINHGEYFRAIVLALEELGCYNIYHQLLDTKEHGVPQSRRRIYFVGIKRSCDDGTFKFPEPVERPSIELFLEPRKARPSKTDLPPQRSGTARRNVLKVLKDISLKGYDPLKVPFLVDIDSSTYRMNYARDVSPCLTCSRGAGHWITNRGRRLTKDEMLRLQGMNPATFKKAVSDTQLGKQIGNAMSVNVLERLFVRALPAAGLAAHGSLVDRWQGGKPPAALTSQSRKRRAAPACAGAAKRTKA
mmetsp:Transcript_56204/g.174295  ORF Transcript_56204/g.174295 Transcript_56204/m.174295 type:complete len:372 (-) Transcript_56204:113-1228(-)|eukprot:CAMPEP_0204601314 /NCGR_PEP_ID=MMETSP0661-20131031/55951_1 /ASSEMBLY_ACC=CAM_ASM_000606 /TAXON_ID=109239 /ORGANISM="Alexandrium margalefi, Strain AMGDE01CS-322" /LENGTH=371 /DNA_ID=CAMNT_0051612165 /DNA_START=62 /DNA_END=1177 /DNA_ORIENTATION=-